MSHRERGLAAFDHRETDRIPLESGSTIVTSAMRRPLGVPDEGAARNCFTDEYRLLWDEEIERNVRDSIETLARNGGHVFCAAHNIQPDVSPDRIDVMYRTALGHQPAGRES